MSLIEEGGPLQVLPWQASAWEEWLRQMEAGRLPHAVLISGLPGLGKRRLGRAFAQAVLCVGEAHLRPCGRCKSCRLIAAECHPDLRLLEPAEAGKAIKIDQVRELLNFVSGTAQQGGWKCVIVDPAEAMNINAANALLKCLEEPPGDTLIVLISSRPGRLLATLRSRCRLLQLAPPVRQDALAWLEPRVGRSAADLLDYARGAPCAALKAHEENRLAAREEIRQALLKLASGGLGPLEAAAIMLNPEGTEALDEMLDLLNRMAREPWPEAQANDSLPAEWGQVAARVDSRLLFRFVDKLMQSKAQLLGSANPNKQLLWEELMLDWRALTATGAAGHKGRGARGLSGRTG